VRDTSKFPTSKYGPASPVAVAKGDDVPKGGGHYKVGKKYKVAGRWYHPKEDENYNKTGLASWYGPTFHGRKTANGEVFDRYALSAAHPTLPMPSYVRVTNTANNHSVIVRVNDRGPFAHDRIIDLSERTAELLDMKKRGVGKVRVEYVGRAGLAGSDDERLLASFTPNGNAQMPSTGHAYAEAKVNPPLAQLAQAPLPPAPLPQNTQLATRYVQPTLIQPVALAATPQPIIQASPQVAQPAVMPAVQYASAYQPVTQQAGQSLVQLGVFGDAGNAQRLAQSMQQHGQVLLETVPSDNGSLYRVRVLVQQNQMDRLYTSAAQAGVVNPRVISY
jgi:rare lipoprotein A